VFSGLITTVLDILLPLKRSATHFSFICRLAHPRKHISAAAIVGLARIPAEVYFVPHSLTTYPDVGQYSL